MAEEVEHRVNWVYQSAGDTKELAKKYDEWAKDYDEDITEHFGYQLPGRVAELVTKYVTNKQNRILDAGAGTGLVGKLLSDFGYNNMIGIDLSRGMLAQAEKKGVYKALHQRVLGEDLGFDTHFFDAVVCVGTLTIGHAPASSLEELIRVTKSNGYIIFSMRRDVYEEHGFKEKQDELVRGGFWRIAEVTEDFLSLPKGEPDSYGRIYVYRVLRTKGITNIGDDDGDVFHRWSLEL
jgi:SAM-dependent methyltransferase